MSQRLFTAMQTESYETPVLLAETVAEEANPARETAEVEIEESQATAFVVADSGVEAKGSLCR